MRDSFLDEIHNLEKQLLDIKTAQFITGDSVVFYRNDIKFHYSNTRRYKVTFVPNIDTNFAAIGRAIRPTAYDLSRKEYTSDIISNFGTEGEWWAIPNNWVVYTGTIEFHVLSTVDGSLRVEEK